MEEVHEPLRRLCLQQITGRATTNRGKQVLLVSRSRQHDDLASGRLGPEERQRLESADSRHREIEEDDVRLELPRELERLGSVAGLTDDVEAAPREQAGEPVARQRMVVDEKDRGRHRPLIGTRFGADKGGVRHDDRDAYNAWLVGELLLVGLLGAALALFLAYPELRTSYDLPALRLALDTGIMLSATIVAVLAGIRFSVEGRRLDLFLCGGFSVAAATTLCFAVVPVLGGDPVRSPEGWSSVGGRTLALAV